MRLIHLALVATLTCGLSACVEEDIITPGPQAYGPSTTTTYYPSAPAQSAPAAPSNGSTFNSVVVPSGPAPQASPFNSRVVPSSTPAPTPAPAFNSKTVPSAPAASGFNSKTVPSGDDKKKKPAFSSTTTQS